MSCVTSKCSNQREEGRESSGESVGVLTMSSDEEVPLSIDSAVPFRVELGAIAIR